MEVELELKLRVDLGSVGDCKGVGAIRFELIPGNLGMLMLCKEECLFVTGVVIMVVGSIRLRGFCIRSESDGGGCR